MEKHEQVKTLSKAYTEAAKRWDMIAALWGGTETMRAAGAIWLPQESKEKPQDYDNRLTRSFLFNVYKDTVDKIISLVFRKPVLVENAPDKLVDFGTNIDGEGTTLTIFARELLENAVNFGISHAFVDFPKIPNGLTLADENNMAVRPIAFPVSPRSLIGWIERTKPGGGKSLELVRWTEIVNEIDLLINEYDIQPHKYIRVFRENTWELWKEEKDKYIMKESGAHTFGAIPLFTMYTMREGFMTAKPALLDLAWLNIAHWQSDSDQRNALRFARTGLLAIFGLTRDEQANQPVILGLNQSYTFEKADAHMDFVEVSGTGLQLGAEDIKNTEMRMQLLGLQPFTRTPIQETATAKMIDEAHNQSEIQAWIRSLETLLKQVYEAAAKWLAIELPNDFSVDINDDFDILVENATNVATLIQLRLTGQITHETLLNELKRRGLFGTLFDIETEVANVNAQMPELGGMTEELVE